MKIKTTELERTALNLAVAHCVEGSKKFPIFTDGEPLSKGNYATDWALAGPIIEREGINLRALSGALWEAETWNAEGGQYLLDGPTPLVAAMRCYVASVFGEEVEVPDEFMGYKDEH